MLDFSLFTLRRLKIFFIYVLDIVLHCKFDFSCFDDALFQINVACQTCQTIKMIRCKSLADRSGQASSSLSQVQPLSVAQL